MPEESPDETPEEADVEAEMLRMMQEEAEGGEEGEADQAGEGADAEGADEAGGDSVDDMLEQEMLRAMQDESPSDGAEIAVGGAEMAPFMTQAGGLVEAAESIDRLAEVDVTVTVVLGSNLVPIQDILAWTRDAVVELEPEEHEPLDILVNGKLFARGEMVVVGDTFGIRIIKLITQPDEPQFGN